MPDSGRLRFRFQFQMRREIKDDFGNTRGDEWLDQFETRADLLLQRGGETVQAARLEGQQPGIAKIRYSRQASQITSDWRCINRSDNDLVYEIRERPRRTDDRLYYEFMVVSGVTT